LDFELHIISISLNFCHGHKASTTTLGIIWDSICIGKLGFCMR